MIKKICLLLVICTVFSFLAFPIASYGEEIENGSNSVSINLMTPADFCVELEEEGIDVENSNEYNIFLLIETKEDPSVDPKNFLASNVTTDAGEEIDAALLQHRELVKEYYSCHNQYVADKLFLNQFDYYVSFYAPYIEVVFDDIDEYAQYEETINEIMCNQELIVSLSNYAALEQGFDEATINSTYSTPYPFDDALDDIGIENFGFSGAGIKVGVIETGYPNNTINLKEGFYTLLGDTQTPHAMEVTSIIGGKTGIAKDVYFYCLSKGQNFTNDCNTLINTYDVDIINMSNKSYVCGYYTKCDAYIDWIISTSGCTFVKSSGNNGNNSEHQYYITAPGCSMNAITVGSIDYNKNISDFSSWFASDDFLLKPDVVAPGGNISDIDNIDDPFGGTSASAPMVTGVIALLMEEFPILKTNPALVKSVLHLGAEPLPSQTNYFDQQAGFGLINYQNMRNCLLNLNYSNFTIPTNTRPDDILLSKSISIPYLDTLKINANTIINSSEAESNGTPATPSYTEYFIIIYDTSTDEYVDVSIIDSSVDYLVFTNTNPNNTSYIIEVMAMENSRSSATEYGSIAYEVVEHNHSFTDRYVWQSHLQHKCYCECGRYSTAAHVVLQGDFPAPGDYAICLRCRGEVSMGVLQSIPTNLPHTDNGSYILTNGTIVLVEEDVEAYMAGTLEFHYGETE